MKTNFVFVDFENVQPDDMILLQADGLFKVKIFLGSNQTKVPLNIVRALQAFGMNAEYIQIEGTGTNALDFHIAFYIGRLAFECPDSFFHIISKDTGFDPLIKHLKQQKILCQRSTSIKEIPVIRAVHAKTTDERVAFIIDNLNKRGSSKPRTLKTLSSSIKAQFTNQTTDEDVGNLTEQLVKRGLVIIHDGKVSYQLS